MQSEIPIQIETRALGTLAYIRKSIEASVCSLRWPHPPHSWRRAGRRSG
jgi:hypothetical protein